jgi:hypothetical protein
MDAISIYIDVQICMFSYILQLICLSTYFFEYKCNIYKKYITNASRTLRFWGFLENDASDAPASGNTSTTLKVWASFPFVCCHDCICKVKAHLSIIQGLRGVRACIGGSQVIKWPNALHHTCYVLHKVHNVFGIITRSPPKTMSGALKSVKTMKSSKTNNHKGK